MSRSWLLLVAVPVVACGILPDRAAPSASPQSELAAGQQAVLEELVARLDEGYLFPDYGGVEWETQAAQLEAQVTAGLSEEEFQAALEALVLQLPPGTASYTSRDERVQAEFEVSNTYEGIGAFVSIRAEPEPRILLLSVIPNSPAARAGLQAHDAVYAVDGTAVSREEGLSVIDRVRGPAGTEVVLEVASPGQAHRQVTVGRAEVVIGDILQGRILAPGLIYLLVPVTVDASLFETLAGLLQDLVEQNQTVVGLVLDLRIAGSSSEWPLNEMLSLLGDGQAGHFNSRAGIQPLDIQGTDFADSQSLPLAVLVGPDTSGAPEVLAAALQAIGRGPIIGLPTSGSVLSFQSHILPDGSLLSFAESSFITPDGTDLSLNGLTPDVIVELDWDQVAAGSDPVLLKALELLQQGS
ncbi:MAG: S41 family peptidase [Anaerolineales bacterium]